MLRQIIIVIALLLPTNATKAQPAAGYQPGEQYEIVKSYETSSEDSDGGSGSSSGQTAIVERVIAVRHDGLELQYDLPAEIEQDDRAKHWEMPAHIFKPFEGPMQLLNAQEMEVRVDHWLGKAGWTREACGRWIFTWNAFRIDCDPQTVIKMIEDYDLGLDILREGESYRTPDALGAGLLKRKIADGVAIFTTELIIAPEFVRQQSAETDIVVAEISGKSITLDAALADHAGDEISGTIAVTIETDEAGYPIRRRIVRKVKISTPDGKWESNTSTQTTERRRLSSSAP